MNETGFSSFVQNDKLLPLGGWRGVPGACHKAMMLLDVVNMECFSTVINMDSLSEI
jgi:hypothetical protein